MREKLNENPLMQAAVLGVLALIVGFMLLRAMSGPQAGSEPAVAGAPPPGAATAEPIPVTTAPAGVSAPTTAPDASAPTHTPDTPAPAPDPGSANGSASHQDNGAGSGFVAGPGLPKDVAAAYDADNVVVLLIVRGSGIDDRRLKPMVESLRSRGDTSVFIVKAFDIAKYSRITQGVNVQRTPALVVVQPKHLTQGPLPTATVGYGFRGGGSIDQAVRDALYSGHDNLPYYPTQ